ncbi:AGAP005926-PA [Anopheles gambiae str. PEST]|uniref:AGAP005926-PA n=1 Tax=Anopheles gambiae TaxID=7165 RepID=Q7PP43_ANOGA|nr:AGAP005926-PA [Anopheles gambiae str. PEST]
MVSDSESSDDDCSEPYEWFLHRLYHKDHKIIPIRETPKIIGRGKDANCQFKPGKYFLVSRNHCMVQIVDGKPTITDCHSRRGTFVNGDRIDKFQPGRIELKEGDLVGIAHKNEEIQQYFKFHDEVLRYRVCRTIGKDEAVVISDDEQEEAVDVKCAILPEPDLDIPSTASSSQSEASQSDTEPVENGSERSASPQPGPSGLQLSAVVSIPEELMRKSSFERQYDDMMLCASKLNPDGYESDTEPEPCVVQPVAYDTSDVIVLSDDDEYIDVQYSQMVIEEVQQELEDDVELVELPDLGEEEEDTSLWALKLKPDVDATRRYKKRAKEAKEEKEASKRERPDAFEKQNHHHHHHKKHRSSSSRSSEEENVAVQREDAGKESSLKVVLKRNSTDAKWDDIETKTVDAKKPSRHTTESSKDSKRDAGDAKKLHRRTTEPIASTSSPAVEPIPSTSKHSKEPTPSSSRHTTNGPSTSAARHTHEPTPSTSSKHTKEPTPSTSRHTNGPVASTSRHTAEPTPSTSRQSYEPATPSTSKHRDSVTDPERNRPALDDKTKKPPQQKQPEDEPNRLKNRRHSVANWTEIGPHRPSGTIEIAMPEKPKPPSKEVAAGPLWMQQAAKPAVAGENSSSNASAAPEESTAASAPKSNLKRRGSVSSVGEVQAMIQKKLKRRYSVSDRNVFDFQPVKVSKDQKEQRKSRLMQINEKKKQQERQGPVMLFEPQPLGRKTGTTKPKVKFTPNNRGSFLTAPVPLPSTSRAPSTSRPAATDESIVCTQSTTLEQLPTANGVEEEVIDMRPKKLTFQSVARVSNVDRPVPSGSGLNKQPLATSSNRSTNMEPPPPVTLAKPQHPSTSGGISNSSSNSHSSSTTTTTSTSSSNSASSSNTATTSATTAAPTASTSQRVLPPQVKIRKKQPLQGILKSYDKPNGENPAPKKSVTIRLELNKTRYIENCLDKSESPPPEKELPEPKLPQKEIQEQILWQELDLLAEVLEWPTKWLQQQESELLANGPFASEGKLLPKLDNYDSYESFRNFHLPFLKRELWQEIYTCAKVAKSFLTLHDVTVGKAEHVELCKLFCKVRINTHGKDFFPLFDFGIVEYHSLLGHKTSLFVSVRAQNKDDSVPLRDSNGVQQQPGLAFVLTLYAAGRELEGLRSGRNFVYRPLARVHLYMRRCNAISLLEHSPLLPNIICPVTNRAKLEEIDRRLQQQPEMRTNVARHMEAGALNPGQMEIVSAVLDECQCWEEPTISLIHGPPGTGKSRVIGNLVLELMRLGHKSKERMRVLVCASSNTAVDVIVKNLMKLQQRKAANERFKLVRTGTRSKVDQECAPVFIDKLVQEEVNRQNRVPDARKNDGSLQNIERERNVLANRIKMAQAELSSGRSVNMEMLKVMKRKLHSLEEVLNPGGTSSASATTDGRKKQEIKARICILQGADIVCTTLGSCSTLASYCTNLRFSVCIIDEATQCTELCSLLPLQYHLSKMVLVGDINQLPATVLDQQCIDAGFRASLFSRLYQSYAGAGGQPPEDGLKMLKTQYRMHPKICHWPNRYFYGGQLKNATCTEAMRKTIPLKPYMVISLSYDQELTQAQYEIYNKDEILFVVELMKQVVRCCDKHASFAIITPYARHKEEMIQSLRSTQLKRVEVHSIDSVQGKEFDVVIISLARSNGAGFLNNPERINVALTRARQCLVLCGNFGSLKHKTVWSSLLEDAEKRKVYYHLEEHDAQVDGQKMVKNIMERLRMT